MLEANEHSTILRKPEVEDHILAVAIDAFSKQGYHNSSVLEIVGKSGLSQEAFNGHFHSKRDIMVALIEKYYTELAELLERNHQRFAQALKKKKDPFSAWRENTTQIFKYHARNPGLTRIIFRDAMAIDEDYAWRVEELSSLIKLQMMDAMHLLESHGLIRPTDLEMVATIMQGAANAIIMSYVVNGSKRDPEELTDQLLGYFVRALAPEGMDAEEAIRGMTASKAKKKRKTGKMPVLEMENSISIEEYFNQAIRQIFKEQVRSTDLAHLHGTLITLQFIVHGDEDHFDGLRIEDGRKMEIVHGPMDKPMITFEMSEEVYRHALKGKVAEALQTFINLNQITDRRRYDQIRELKGSLSLELLMQDGTVLPFKLIFNGVKLPVAVFRMSLDDYIAMGRGELYGMSAFVSGRLEVDGDKPFAMQLSNLLR